MTAMYRLVAKSREDIEFNIDKKSRFNFWSLCLLRLVSFGLLQSKYGYPKGIRHHNSKWSGRNLKQNLRAFASFLSFTNGFHNNIIRAENQ